MTGNNKEPKEKHLLHPKAAAGGSDSTLHMVQMAMLVAISSILVFACFPIIPAAPFLKYDMADVPILMSAMSMGAPAGMIVLIIASAIQAFLFGHDGPIGFLMHVIASGVLILTARGVYLLGHKSNVSKILGLILGSLAMAAVMIPLNFIFTPKVMMDVPIAQAAAIFWQGLTGSYDPAAFSEVTVTAYETVKALLLVGLIPFNLLKAGLNCAIFYGVDKALPRLIKKK